MLDQRPLLYKGRIQIVASIASKISSRSQIVASVNFDSSTSACGSQKILLLAASYMYVASQRLSHGRVQVYAGENNF